MTQTLPLSHSLKVGVRIGTVKSSLLKWRLKRLYHRSLFPEDLNQRHIKNRCAPNLSEPIRSRFPRQTKGKSKFAWSWPWSDKMCEFIRVALSMTDPNYQTTIFSDQLNFANSASKNIKIIVRSERMASVWWSRVGKTLKIQPLVKILISWREEYKCIGQPRYRFLHNIALLILDLLIC